jgi:hypothetical protein
VLGCQQIGMLHPQHVYIHQQQQRQQELQWQQLQDYMHIV